MKVRLLFDACISHILVGDLAAYSKVDPDQVEVLHVLQQFAGGAHDARLVRWLQDSASDSRIRPLLVTADRGKKTKLKKDKLPLICSKIGVPYIALTSGLHTAKQTTKRAVFAGAWQEIVSIAKQDSPSNYSLGMRRVQGDLIVPYFRKLG